MGEEVGSGRWEVRVCVCVQDGTERRRKGEDAGGVSQQEQQEGRARSEHDV